MERSGATGRDRPPIPSSPEASSIGPAHARPCDNNGTVPPLPMATYASEQTLLSLWTTLVNVEVTEAHIRDHHYGRSSPSERPVDDRRLSVHGLGPIWFDLSAIVALLIAIAAVASWVAALASLVCSRVFAAT